MELPGGSWAQSRLDRLSTSPFSRLCGHFLRALTQSGQESEQLEFGAGALLAVFAVPGVFAALSLFDRYSTFLSWYRGQPPSDAFVESVPDKYFFIVFSMVITGIVAIFKWDRILPSKQDYFNFAPLPIAPVGIYLASLTAALAAAGIFALDVNAGSMILFPMVVMASVQGASFSSFLAFVATQTFIVVLASLFTFFACYGLMTTALAVLPSRWFTRLSVPLRVAMMVALLGMLVSNGVVSSAIQTHPEGWMSWLPPVWFVALYQKLQSSGPTGLAALAARAWFGTGIAVAAAAAASWLGYHRYFRRIPEMSDGGIEARQGAPGRGWRLVRLLARRPVDQALFGFSLRVLLRSETHTLVIGALFGLGLLLATEATVSALHRRPMSDALPSPTWLSVPLIFTYLLAVAVRLSFELPAVWKANWVFAYLLDPAEHRAPAVARRVIYTAMIPLWLITCGAFAWYWNLSVGLVYSTYVTAAGAMLIELLVVDFCKVPFTCSLPPFRNDTLVVILGHIVGFGFFTAGGAQIASTMLRSPLRFLLLAAMVTGLWAAARYWLRESTIGASGLQFTPRQEAALQTLDLTDRA